MAGIDVRESIDTKGSRSPTLPFQRDHAIAEIALQIRQSLDLATIWQTTVDAVQQLLGCDRALLYQFAADKSGQVVVEAVPDPQWSILGQTVHDACFEADWLKPYDERQARAIADVSATNLTPCHAEFLAGFQVKANLVVPVLCESELWGLLIAHHCTVPRAWLPEEIAALQQAAIQVGIAIQQASLVMQLQAANAKLEAQAELALRQSHDQRLQLAAIVESSQDAIISKTPEGIITSWNSAAERLFGYSAAEAIGQPITLIIPPDRQAEAALIFQRLHQGQSIETYETQRRCKDGRLVDVALTISPIQDETGLVIGASKIARDITAQRQAQYALQDQTATFQSFYNSSPLMMGVVELSDCDILHISNNQATATFFNTTVEALEGQWAKGLGVHPDLIQIWMRYYRQSQSFKRPVQFDYAHTTDTTTAWLSVVVSYIGLSDSQRPRFSYVATDISDRKQAEADLHHFSVVLENALEGIARLDLAGQYLSVNRAYGAICGYEPSSLIGQVWTTTVYTDDLPTLEAAYETMRVTGKVEAEARGVRQDGSLFYKQVTMIANYDPQGVFIGHYCFLKDISDRKQSEADLKWANDQLELVLQASSEGFWDWDLITGEIYFSPQWKAMLGYTDHELENSPEMWQSLIFEEDLTQALQLIDDYNNGRAQGFTATQRFHHRDGSVVHILSRAIHLKDEQGRAVRMVGSHLDITPTVTMQTALKTSEMQLSGILNSSLDGVMAFQSVRDEQGTIVDFEWLLSNPTACDLVGRTEADLVGNRLLEEMPGNREEGLFEGYVHTVETGAPYQREFHYDHDGIESWFESIAVKLGDGFAVTFRNVTTLKQSEQTLHQLNQQLEDRVADLDQRHAEMVTLSEITDFLQACSTVEEACNTIANLVEPLFPHCSGGIFITRASRNRLESVAAWGSQHHSHSDFEPHSCWGLRRGRMHWVGQDRLSLRCSHIPSDGAIAATLCIPMMAQGETLGLLCLSTETPEALPEAKHQMARTLAEQVGMAIANLKLQETLKHQSIRDPLTGLYNRRYLEESLTQEIVRAQRNQHPIGVLMIDIDHFKRFNDTYGHDTGDAVLKLVGTLLKDNVRNSDIACRYGGEEMTLILPEANLAETAARAEIIRAAITQLRLSQNSQLIDSITASFGVACFPQHGSTGPSLIKAADAALYRAKEAGRNQVLIAL